MDCDVEFVKTVQVIYLKHSDITSCSKKDQRTLNHNRPLISTDRVTKTVDSYTGIYPVNWSVIHLVQLNRSHVTNKITLF